MKTLKSWEQSKLNWDDYAKIGDEVAEEVAIYFGEVVYPETFTSALIQCGEPIDEVNGEFTYMTFKKEKGKWYYVGPCYSGSIETVQ